MKKLLFLLLLASVSCFGQVTKDQVKATIDEKIKNGLRPVDIQGAMYKQLDYSRQADSIAGVANAGLAGKANTSHSHSATNITSGTLPVVRGGTGLATTGAAGQLLRTNTAGTALEYFTPPYLSSYTETDPNVGSHVKAISTTNISNWNSAYSWGSHSGLYPLLSGSYSDPSWLTITKAKVGLNLVDNTPDLDKPISTATKTVLDLKANSASLSDYASLVANNQFIGTNTFSATTTIQGLLNSQSIYPDGHNTRWLGASSANWSTIWGVNFLSSVNGAASFGTTLSTNAILFKQGGSNTNVGGFFATTGNYFIQASGVPPSDNGYRFQNYGNAYLGGDIQVAGNILPDGNLTRDIGGATSRYSNLYVATIQSNNFPLSVSTSSSPLYFRQAPTGSGVYAGFIGGSGNYFIQAPGAIPTDNGYRFQLYGSQRITGDLVHSLSSNSYSYNTLDESTNYERIKIGWSSNLFSISAESGGTGSIRDIRLGSDNAYFSVGNLPTVYRSMTSNNQSALSVRSVVTSSSGSVYGLSVTPTFNQSGTAGYNGLLISPYEQAVGSGSRYLFNAGYNTAANLGGTHTSVFTIDNTGSIVSSGGLTVGGNIVPSTNNANNLGSSSQKFNALFINSITTGTATAGFSIRSSSPADINFYVHPTTRNTTIQSPGATPTDRGYTLDVQGNQAISGTLTLNDGVLSKTTGGNWTFGNTSVTGVQNLTLSSIVGGNQLAFATSGVFGRNGSFAESSAVLEASSTTKGFLPPRMTEANKNAIPSPAEGLLIFQNSGTKGWYGYLDGAWVKLNP